MIEHSEEDIEEALGEPDRLECLGTFTSKSLPRYSAALSVFIATTLLASAGLVLIELIPLKDMSLIMSCRVARCVTELKEPLH